MFPLLLITVEVKNTICNSLITMFTTSWRNLIKIGWSELYKILSFFFFFFLQKAVSHVNHSDISLAPFWKRFLQVKQFHDAKGFNTRLPSFVIPKITVVWHSTHETRIKDHKNMEDLTCLLATVRTLKPKGWKRLPFSAAHSRIPKFLQSNTSPHARTKSNL